MKQINIEDKLIEARGKSTIPDILLEEIKAIIEDDDYKESQIYHHIKTREIEDHKQTNDFNIDLLETKNIYHLDQIKQICSTYRLRFLDSHYFKDELPYEAVQKTKHLQKTHQTTLKGFKILAPAKCFKLKNADDPLLFAPIGNGYYYLIHKWGNDLSFWRKIAMWPLRNLDCMIFFLLGSSIFLTIILTKILFSEGPSISQFITLAFFMFIWLGGTAIFLLFRKGVNFSPAVWQSQYFNA